jgi:outer membrane receptor protein involved in Fe transport
VGRHTIVAGADFMDGRLESNFEPHREFDHREYGLFVNDTIIAGSLCVTPGLRYDHSDRAGGIVSPSLGATWLASRDLLFRAIVSRGFHEPAITKYEDAPGIGYVGNEDLTPEIVWSYQAGVEANVAGLLRAKLTLFYHDIDDVLVDKVTGIPVGLTAENAGKAHSWGGQLELVAREHRGFTFEAGASYEQIELENFSDLLHEPRRDVYGFNGAATYDGGKRFRATLRGHYLWWDMYRRFAGDYDGFIVDANLITEVARRDRLALEVFFTARNIFDAASYSDSAQRNPGRWVEAGVRCSF